VEVKQRGKILAYLTSAHAASKEPFVKRRIERAIRELCIELTEDSYKELVDGYLETKIPLELLMNISSLLPGQPILAEIPGKMEGFFVKKGEELKTIVGLNESGKKLVTCMVNAVKERGKETKKPEDIKNNREQRG
jgi:hypothetical protein